MNKPQIFGWAMPTKVYHTAFHDLMGSFHPTENGCKWHNSTVSAACYTFLSVGLLVLATTTKATSLTLNSSRLVSSTDQGQLLVSSSLEITGSGNIYVVDGINNSLKVINPSSSFPSFSNSSNGQFKWFRNLRLNESGNVYRSSYITSNKTNNVYLLDGINNSLEALTLNSASNGSGNIYAVDGMNNSLQVLNSSRGFLSSSNSGNGQFRWFKNLRLNRFGKVVRSSDITTKRTNNVYLLDGINNKLQALATNSVSNGLANVHVVDGINNTLQAFNLSRDVLSSNQSKGQFKWLKNLKLNESGRVTRSSNITAKEINSAYLLDGINNSLKTLTFNSISNGLGNVHVVDGINNNPQISSSNSNFLPFFDNYVQFHWLNNLNSFGNVFWSNRIISSEAKNVYLIDGINNKLETLISKGVANSSENIYVVDGINNNLQILPPNTDSLFYSNNSSSNFNWGNLFADSFNNMTPTNSGFLSYFASNNGQFSSPTGLPFGEFNSIDLASNPFLSFFANLNKTQFNSPSTIESVFSSLLGSEKEQFNLSNPTTSNTNEINALNTETTQIPEPSSVLGLALLGIKAAADILRKFEKGVGGRE